MATASRNPHLFPEKSYIASLDAWAASLQTRPTFLEARRCLIEQIVHYKAALDMEHEYLVVYARHPSGARIVLCVDRNAEDDMDQASSSRYAINSMTSSSNTQTPEEAGITAFDGVEVSHDGTPAPILARHGASLELTTLSFPPLPGTSGQSPTLLNLTILLLVLRGNFPAYILLRHQCYFFARATLLSLSSLFPSTETPHPKNAALQGTWRGAHVSLFDAGKTALQNMLLLPLLEFPVLLVPAGLFAIYSTVKLYDGHSVADHRERLEISDEKIRKYGIPKKYAEAWNKFMADWNADENKRLRDATVT
ncbi:hypothetical protein OF83DRAFT_760812 [Amylostereum chailletii]|nr:hypothetical protein OF83DRAFT_760812 [Amylostereum chailletii]